MTFLEKYQSETTWHGKAIVMGLFHLTMTVRHKDWTLARTAHSFDVSIGLVSENLRLANAINTDDKILKCNSRQEALRKLNVAGRRNGNGDGH
jgi:hypothetical protein